MSDLSDFINNSELSLMRQSNFATPNFIQRLKSTNRKHILNWQNKNQISTHKMSYADIDGQEYVYPNIQ